MSDNVVPLKVIHRQPVKISFGPVLSALQNGYNAARTPWIRFGKYLTLVGGRLILVDVDDEKFYVGRDEDLLADDWVILDGTRP